ncbi:hypothetical protein BDZ91DRAFT_827799 [Kalaharituber pfeilii]|nr:hypothetical protein BDZ91DRAFT_827799 [Kalaharituber pfeilii]
MIAVRYPVQCGRLAADPAPCLPPSQLSADGIHSCVPPPPPVGLHPHPPPSTPPHPHPSTPIRTHPHPAQPHNRVISKLQTSTLFLHFHHQRFVREFHLLPPCISHRVGGPGYGRVQSSPLIFIVTSPPPARFVSVKLTGVYRLPSTSSCIPRPPVDLHRSRTTEE